MDNYEYIIASLPVLHPEDVRADHLIASELIDEIREQLSAPDNAALDFLLSGYDPDQMTPEFYQRALKHKNRFLRQWFAFDLDLRNTTVAYLNDSLGREEGQDIMQLEGRGREEFPEEESVNKVLRGADILERESGLDELRWRKIEEITMMNYFDIEAVLGFVVKLKIIDRWLQLDPDSGRALFRRMVEEIRSTYDNKKQNIAI